MFGLVLEGGGTKGAYHLGAYKALCELEIPVDCIVGSSIGAINGALFAQGDLERAYTIWDDISAKDIINLPENILNEENVFDIKNLQAFYKEFKEKKGFDITPLDTLLREVVDEEKIRNSSINFGLAAFNVTGIKEQQMFISDIPKNKLVDYLLASACLPIFIPKKINNSVFMDGGITNNLPVDMLIKAGYRDIICIEVGGIGVSKNVSGGGCNIISVKCEHGSVKTLDFSRGSIYEARLIGYYDTLKTFGKLSGEKYYFPSDNYNESKLKYSSKTLHGLEHAAEYFQMNRLKIYTVEELAEEVIFHFRSTTIYDSIIEVLKKSDREKVAALARSILNSDSEMLESGAVAGILGNMFEAASAVAYFAERNKNQ